MTKETLAHIYQKQSWRFRASFSAALFCVSLTGIWATNRFEELYPLPKRTIKSPIDIKWQQEIENELEKE